MNNHGLHMRRALSVEGLRREMRRADGINSKIAVVVTGWVSTMWCAYFFALLALLSLPAILTQAFNLHLFPKWIISASLISLVAWISSYFLQLVLLSVLSVQQAVEGVKNAAASARLAEQVDLAVDRLDTDTQGGLNTILEHVVALEVRLDPQTLWEATQRGMQAYSRRNQGITAGDILEAKKKLPPDK